MQTVRIGASLTQSSPHFSFSPFCLTTFSFFFLAHFYICQNQKKKNAPTGQILEKKKKMSGSVCNFSNSVAGVFPSSRGVRRLSGLPLPDLICTSHSAAEDYGQAEAGGNRRLRFPRLCFTTAGKERETLKLSHVQWHPRKKKSLCSQLQSSEQIYGFRLEKTAVSVADQ